MAFTDLNVDWDKMGGLVPAIVQHADTAEVLMLGYMNPEALLLSLEDQKVTFFSRSRQTIWQKGATSGNFLKLVSISLDCDLDALLVLALPEGPTCHRGTNSCFTPTHISPLLSVLEELEYTIEERIASGDTLEKPSYTARLYKKGLHRMAQKVGEEGLESALAGVAGTDEELISESADYLFHLLVLLKARDLSIFQVLRELRKRRQSPP
jgi:phosphoribosyl-ATP pyrophosphohydrolase/phosphoribosyl-AMP cyclohydrolase